MCGGRQWPVRAISTAGGEEAERIRREIAAALGSSSLLSERELQVLRLIAEGMTNQQVARALTLSPHTVHRHVAHILTKLDQPTRAAAVAYGVTNDML